MKISKAASASDYSNNLNSRFLATSIQGIGEGPEIKSGSHLLGVSPEKSDSNKFLKIKVLEVDPFE